MLWFALVGAKHLTIDLYGAGPTATACSVRRKKSFPRLREFRRVGYRPVSAEFVLKPRAAGGGSQAPFAALFKVSH